MLASPDSAVTIGFRIGIRSIPSRLTECITLSLDDDGVRTSIVIDNA